MTISTAPAPLSFAGDDSTVGFTITWKYFAKADVVATHRDSAGNETTWVLTTDYTLTAAGVSTGGTLTATTAPATGETLVLTPEPGNTQAKALPRGGTFPSPTVEPSPSAPKSFTLMMSENRAANVRAVSVPVASTVLPLWSVAVAPT